MIDLIIIKMYTTSMYNFVQKYNNYEQPPTLSLTHDTAHDMWKKDATNKTKIMELSMPRKSA